MNKILLLAGPSGTGKTTVQTALEQHGLKAVASYTSRSPRHKGERGHIFVSREDILNFPDKVAFTDYNGNLYCATAGQIDASDLYVVDLDGIETFKQEYKGKKIPIVVGLTCPWDICLKRMLERGDTAISAADRIVNDKKVFAELETVANVLIDTSKDTPEEIAEHILALL